MKKILLSLMILIALYKVTSSQTSGEKNSIIKSVVKDESNKNFELYESNPKLFKEITNIQFEIYREGKVNLYVNDLKGKPIEILVDGNMEPGKYSVYFKANKDLTPGVYIYKLEVDGESQSKEMILIN